MCSVFETVLLTVCLFFFCLYIELLIYIYLIANILYLIDALQIASEILANMSCVVRNSFLDDVVAGSYEHGQASGTGDYEWEDDDEASEQKMEAMARDAHINGGGSGEGLGNDGQVRGVFSVLNSYPWVL